MKKEKTAESKGSIIKHLFESLLVFLVIFLMAKNNKLSSFDYILKDALYQKPRGVQSNIKIIAIDEKTLDRLGRIDTWSRQTYADLINTLNVDDKIRPAVIGFDIIFASDVDEGDQALSDAVAATDNVVTGYQYKYEDRYTIGEDGQKILQIESVASPYASLSKASPYKGYFNISQDSDGIVRRFKVHESDPEEVAGAGTVTSSFSYQVYDRYLNVTGKATDLADNIPTDKYGRTLINYSGKPGDYEAVSLIDVLDGNIDPRAFTGSIVLVGAYAPGMQDSFNVPNGGSAQMYGVEVHANIIQALLQGRFAVNANPNTTSLIFAFVGMFSHLIFRRRKVWLSTVVLVLVIGGQMFAGVYFNNHGQSMSLIYLPIVVIISYIYSIALRYVTERRKRKKVLNAFKKYVAPEIVEELAKKGEFKIKLGGENRDIAVLFVDIRGFTTMSEKLEPEQVVDILNRYLALTTKSIFDNKGTLDKFVGDATMAVFNSPFDLEDYEYKAVCAALDIVAGGEAIKEEFEEKYGQSVGFGVGVNCGPAVVGNVGCDFRMDFTAIGDTVNTAARLEANAKRGQVYISEEMYRRLEGRIEVEEVGIIPLKGKSNGIFVYNVTGLKESMNT